MEQNKTGRYFKYAIGEIILVVIGILIALQINNWNEDRKLKAEYVSDLNTIKENLKSDSITINTNLINGRRINEERQSFLNKDSSVDKSALIDLLGRPNLFLDNSGFENAKNKGTLIHIKNDSLKAILNAYYIKEIEIAKARQEKIIKNSSMLRTYYLQAGNNTAGVSQSEIMNNLMLQSPFRHLLRTNLASRNNIIQQFEDMLKLNIKLSKTIDHELKHFQ
ncbi:DUF6090 family protein [Winogradskyella maritima]|uniref:DUF6090 family protein n=2 Tax=Winogradskyella maritima TaxID=1517766 RepID=A0ABV8AJW9_9FLAO|nr:DUF6090 family protein [Winogradskyella maritima]